MRKGSAKAFAAFKKNALVWYINFESSDISIKGKWLSGDSCEV